MEHDALHHADGTRMITLDHVWLHDDYDADMHIHAGLELSYVKSGSGLYEIGDRTRSYIMPSSILNRNGYGTRSGAIWTTDSYISSSKEGLCFLMFWIGIIRQPVKFFGCRRT